MSVRVKRAAAGILAPLGILRLCGTVKSHVASELLLLGYHRILPIERGETHHGDLELISATPDEFAWQVKYLCGRFEPVTFKEIADCLDGNGQLPRRAIAITFDDGFADVYEHAFPILQRAGIPATVFVSTDYVGQPKPFWFDLVAWILITAPTGTVIQLGDAEPIRVNEPRSVRNTVAITALKWLKNCSEEERDAAVKSLYQQFPEATARGTALLGRALTWTQMREMVAGGIEFGSHTVTHRCLAELSQPDLEHELIASKAQLEEHLNVPITALAYPFGGPTAFSDEVIATARRAGYSVCTTYIPGVNSLSNADRFALRRQHVERDTSRHYFEAIVNAPEWFD